MDGLGGGVFLGGGFPDDPELAETTPSPQQVVDSRFSRMARYLDAADEILAPGVGEDLSERARADFEPIARHYAAHPNGATLTAYLTRTLPGISMAPSRVLGGAQPTITPSSMTASSPGRCAFLTTRSTTASGTRTCCGLLISAWPGCPLPLI